MKQSIYTKHILDDREISFETKMSLISDFYYSNGEFKFYKYLKRIKNKLRAIDKGEFISLNDDNKRKFLLDNHYVNEMIKEYNEEIEKLEKDLESYKFNLELYKDQRKTLHESFMTDCFDYYLDEPQKPNIK